MPDPQVLVVGAGLAGLSAATFLALHGVSVTVIERHASTSVQPRARGQAPLTMEALAVAGIAAEALAVSPADQLHVVIAESLVGRELKVILGDENPDFSQFSPAPWALASQEQLEPILLRRARELGAMIAFNTELTAVTQDAHGVRATVRERTTGAESILACGYLVAADGHRGTVAELVGIGMHGPGPLGNVVSIVFEADLSEQLQNRRFALYHFQGAVPGATLVTTDDEGRYALHVNRANADLPSVPEAIDLIRLALGIADLDLTVLDIAPWTVALRIANSFVAGRTALIGDAAKLMPPTGGFGGNAAILDAYSLAWKLAMMLRGQAGPELLETHDVERRPFAELVAAEQFAQMRVRVGNESAPSVAPVDPATALFGFRFPLGAIAREADDDGAELEDPRHPTGRPGSRAAFVTLPQPKTNDLVARPPASTTDLFGGDFVLLTGSVDSIEAAAAASIELAVPIRTVLLKPSAGLKGFEWPAAYGIGPLGATLVRPDGIIAWRTSAPATITEIRAALNTTLRRR
jgi:putative polyketide hydroxylase